MLFCLSDEGDEFLRHQLAFVFLEKVPCTMNDDMTLVVCALDMSLDHLVNCWQDFHFEVAVTPCRSERFDKATAAERLSAGIYLDGTPSFTLRETGDTKAVSQQPVDAIPVLGKPLADHKTNITYRHAQNCSPGHINHSDKNRPVFHGCKVGKIISGVCYESKQCRT